MNVPPIQFLKGFFIDQKTPFRYLREVNDQFPSLFMKGQRQFLNTGSLFQKNIQRLIHFLILWIVLSFKDLLDPFGKSGNSNGRILKIMKDIVHLFQPQSLHQFLSEKSKNLNLFLCKSSQLCLGIKNQKIVDHLVHF